jgi:hypothetical protein
MISKRCLEPNEEEMARQFLGPAWTEPARMPGGTSFSSGFGGPSTSPWSMPATPQSLNVPDRAPILFQDEGDMFNQTNRGNNWQLPLRLPPNPQYELGAKELVFVQWSSRQDKISDGTYQARSLSMLNFHLTTPEMRKKFGSRTDCVDLLNTWRFYGIEQHDFENTEQNTLAFHVFGVVDYVPNIWNASGKDVQHNDRLWLLVRREPYVSVLVQALGDKRQRLNDENDYSVKPGTLVSFKPAREPDEGKQEHVWGFYPWHTRPNVAPPQSLWSGPDWVGDRLYIGRVLFLHGDHAPNKHGIPAAERHKLAMQLAIFPSAYDDKYREALHEGNSISLVLRAP